MQRPIMNPMFMKDKDADRPKKQRLTWWGRAKWCLGLLWTILLGDMFWFLPGKRLKVEDGHPLVLVVRHVLYRALFIPLAMALVIAAMVYLGTHPPRTLSVADPMTRGMYYDPVSFVSLDGVRLEGWLVPILDAKTVIEKKDEVYKLKGPGIVLVHDYGASRLQMLPLVQPLHEAGYVVLVITLRGTGGLVSNGSAFGLREYADVLAGVDLLRRHPNVDGKRIAVLGIGTGANAAILAAERDPAITALILDHPIINVNDVIDHHIAPPQQWLQWMKPICKWTFELAYRCDAEDLDLTRRTKKLQMRPILMFNPDSAPPHSFSSNGIVAIREFLGKYLDQPGTATASTGN